MGVLEGRVETRIVHGAWWHTDRRIGTRMRISRGWRDAHWWIARVHHMRWRIRISLAGHRWRVATIGGLEVEGLGIVIGRGFDFKAFMGKDAVEIVEAETWNVSAQQRLALKKLAFNFLDMASWRKGLPVSVLLVALYARCSTRRAAGVL